MRKFFATAGFFGLFLIAAFAGSLIAALAGSSPAQAQGGLFEALFGRPRPTVTYYQYAPTEGLRFPVRPPAPRAARANPRPHGTLDIRTLAPGKPTATASKAAIQKRRVASLDPRIGLTAPKTPMQKAICCKDGEDPAKAILADPTLRPGDAYMTEKGLRIFSGRAHAKARAAFVDLRRATIGKLTKARLFAASDARPRAAKAKQDARPAAPAYLTVDPAGRTIRAVGPYRIYHGEPAFGPRRI